MLSESERQKLTEIESLLQSEDPAFVGRFNRDRPSLPRRPVRGLALILAVVAAAVCAAVIGQLSGGVAIAVVGWTVAGASVAVWLSHGRR